MFEQTDLFDDSEGAGEGSLLIHNRKYLGSKHRLLDFLTEIMVGKAGPIGTFLDGFAGTGVVALRFTLHAQRVVANDILLSNAVINRAFLMSSPENVSLPRVRELIEELNSLEPIQGYAWASYGGTYFTPRNAGLIDAIRERIEGLHSEGSCTEQESCMLLASLLFAADKVANTVGQYDAFLKNLHSQEHDDSGRHLVDSNVQKRLRLLVPRIRLMDGHRVYREDINELIGRIPADVIYLDPPYNTRQYIDCYHVLDNIARWDKPELHGKTKKFRRDRFRSRYSTRRECARAFRELIRDCRGNHIFLSYNNEGILEEQVIFDALRSRGECQVFERPYRIFGNGAGRSRKREIVERLFYCRVRGDPVHCGS